MYKMFNSKVLYVIPIIFLIIIVFRIIYSYHDIQQQAYNFAKTEADVLNAHAISNRNYYQKLFINKVLPLNKKTLMALPAYSSRPISKNFSQDNQFNVQLQTVSDRARNSLNSADKNELKAINYFKMNENEKKYFSDEDSEYYQYASVLKIEKKCLTCHGKRESAPKFIRDNYTQAYDYKIGEVRGIVSIKIPKETLRKYFFKSFLFSVVYDILIFLALFFAIFYLIRKSKKINEFLEFEVKSKTKELKKSLVIDRLTKLPNRLQLLEDIAVHDNSSSRHIALLNIDRFKDINDFYGHKFGDEVLIKVAQSIKKSCTNRSSGVYKLPSDEYALFTTMDISQENFEKLIIKIIKNIEQEHYIIENHSIIITLSCGLASNISGILTKADMALQVSKKNKKNLIIYDKSLDLTAQIQENLKSVKLLKHALEHDNLVPFYQPIYNVQEQKIEKYEALARIVRTDGDIILPFRFLDIAIKSKLYPNITKTIIKKSFEFFKDKNYEFSINLSIIDITNRDTVAFIINSLENYDATHRVVFEILESDKIGNYEELKEFIKSVKEFNCKIAIDDFGSGYSNFAHILELNIDYLKIDGSLVKYVTTDTNSRIITQTIISFAQSLGIKTIAEFVEDEISLNLLEDMGIDFIQGYYIGKPEPTLVKESK